MINQVYDGYRCSQIFDEELNIDLQKLIRLLTAAVSTVRMDVVWSSGKPVIMIHVIQSILILAINGYILKKEF